MLEGATICESKRLGDIRNLSNRGQRTLKACLGLGHKQSFRMSISLHLDGLAGHVGEGIMSNY